MSELRSKRILAIIALSITTDFSDPVPCNAKAISKDAFIEAASMGVSLDLRDRVALKEIEKSVIKRAPAPALSNSRMAVDKRKKSDTNGYETTSKPKSLIEQLKAYGGPGEGKVDKSLKKQLEQMNGN